MKSNTVINIAEIRDFYKDFCRENEISFSEKKFELFLRFLEIDFYDWIKENLKQFIRRQE